MNADLIKAWFLGDRDRYEIIPLGTNCNISHYFRDKGMRTVALPFDWNVVSIQAAISLLNNGFADFLNEDNLVPLKPVLRLLFDERGVELEVKNDIITPVVCQKYNMLFPHDFPENYADSINDVKEKYARRIARLKALLCSDKQLMFVHHNGALNEWQNSQYAASRVGSFHNEHEGWMEDLSSILASQYPELSYSLYELRDIVAVLDGDEGRRRYCQE